MACFFDVTIETVVAYPIYFFPFEVSIITCVYTHTPNAISVRLWRIHTMLWHVLVSPFKVTVKHYVEISVLVSNMCARLCGEQYEIRTIMEIIHTFKTKPQALRFLFDWTSSFLNNVSGIHWATAIIRIVLSLALFTCKHIDPILFKRITF